MKEDWRRGRDSNPPRPLRICKLQTLHCHCCRQRQRCRGSLPTIAHTAEVKCTSFDPATSRARRTGTSCSSPKSSASRQEARTSRFAPMRRFATPDIYEALEARGVDYAIRIPANRNLELAIEEILFRPPGQPTRKPLFAFIAAFMAAGMFPFVASGESFVALPSSNPDITPVSGTSNRHRSKSASSQRRVCGLLRHRPAGRRCPWMDSWHHSRAGSGS
jgi:hypothetical protein